MFAILFYSLFACTNINGPCGYRTLENGKVEELTQEECDELFNQSDSGDDTGDSGDTGC